MAGFWDMVYIQVEHINALFTELGKIRNNGWKKTAEVGSKRGIIQEHYMLHSYVMYTFIHHETST